MCVCMVVSVSAHARALVCVCARARVCARACQIVNGVIFVNILAMLVEFRGESNAYFTGIQARIIYIYIYIYI